MFKVYYLSYCPHSQATLNTLKKLNLKHNLIECDSRNIEYTNSDNNTIPEEYKTYPQVLFKTNKKNIFIGGNQEFQKLITLFNTLKEKPNAKIEQQKCINKNKTCYILYNMLK